MAQAFFVFRGLVAALLPPLLTEVRRLRTDKGETIKFLWKLFDGPMVESVLMRYPGRATLCISSQAGCGMACPFCATGQMGLTRNLSAAEIVEQVRFPSDTEQGVWWDYELQQGQSTTYSATSSTASSSQKRYLFPNGFWPGSRRSSNSMR